MPEPVRPAMPADDAQAAQSPRDQLSEGVLAERAQGRPQREEHLAAGLTRRTDLLQVVQQGPSQRVSQ